VECLFIFFQSKLPETHALYLMRNSTPLYQILTHALADKNNTTKFKLIYANVTEKDILLREELDTLKAKFPKTFDVVYLLDKASEGWKGPVGFVTADIIKANVGSPDLKEKVKIFVCGK
jgi:cytochrome-b5 reductase